MTAKIVERYLSKLPPWVRTSLDTWKPTAFALAIAVSGLAIWALVQSTQISATQAQQTKDEAVKAAQIQASAQAAFTQCIASRPELSKLNSFLKGVNEAGGALRDISAVLVANAAAVLQATPASDPQHRVRAANVKRIAAVNKKAERATLKIGAIKNLPVPTKAACKGRRKAVLAGH